ncbi:MAG: hypothetical protein KKA99_01855 [Gammaproteobacteria bacterium]|nr:hypothetical protein [Gammaproteobacteria bacterium]MBU1559057.1 hypothetical protein [Gammaproteobacteria bacterium]MBU2546109.1 hypothetical protein [Gammaproteobacteria bacterium]
MTLIDESNTDQYLKKMKETHYQEIKKLGNDAIPQEEYAKKVSEIVVHVPKTPEKTLRSRRRLDDIPEYPGKELQVRCDAVAFALNEESTDKKLVELIQKCQATIKEIFERDPILDLQTKRNFWNESNGKRTRRHDKPYKIQKNLHLSFSGSVPPCSIKEYLDKKLLQRRCPLSNEPPLKQLNKFEKIKKIIQDYANSCPRGVVKECKFNPDGHIVVRITIKNVDGFLLCKERLFNEFGNAYVRHDDPEKQTTLAAVIAVVDIDRLSSDALKEEIRKTVTNLDSNLKGMELPLENIVWREFDKRTISPESILRDRQFRSKI